MRQLRLGGSVKASSALVGVEPWRLGDRLRRQQQLHVTSRDLAGGDKIAAMCRCWHKGGGHGMVSRAGLWTGLGSDRVLAAQVEATADWTWTQPGRLVFLDETWATTNMTPTRDRAP